MAEEKVTTMVLSVDLQCSKCYKMVKKLLCKFPEIREQTFDEKANKVTIKVVSSSAEKIKDKLLCKGCGCIKSIEIKPPTPPKPPPPPPPKDKPLEVSVDLQVQGFCYCKFCSGRPWDPCSCGGQGQCDQCCCKWCSGRPWGPCSCGGRGQCDLCCGRPVCGGWARRGSRWEETQQGCSIM